MNNNLLLTKGYITTLPEQDQIDIKNCKIAIEEVMLRYNEGISCLALALIGLEKQDD